MQKDHGQQGEYPKSTFPIPARYSYCKCRVGDTNVFRIIRGPPVGFVGAMARICIPNVNEQGPLALAISVARRKNG